MFFSARLDETGTDGRSEYAILAGGVTPPPEWDAAEAKWTDLLDSRGVKEFHTKEWNDRSDDFSGWSALKRKNFAKAQSRIIDKYLIFPIAVAVHRATHTKIKEKLRGIKGFHPDSDIGMAFRLLRFRACEKLVRLYKARQIATPPQLQIIVEDGPWSADLSRIYQEVRASADSTYKPAAYGGMLAGFASIPHGQLKSLEIADYICGRSIADLQEGRFLNRQGQLCQRVPPELLEEMYLEILKEKERRREYGKRRPKDEASTA